jgi:putative addiction module component (TIGR02574 family)
MSVTDILAYFHQLTPAEQRALIKVLSDELSGGLSPEQIVELERRAQELRRNPERGITREVIRAQLRGSSSANESPNTRTRRPRSFQ